MTDLVLRASNYPGDEWRADAAPTPQAIIPRQTRGARPKIRIPRPRGAQVRRAVAASAIVCTLLCTLVARPAHAEPGGSTVPDTGARPVPNGPVRMPGQNTPNPNAPAAPVVLGPLGTQIMAETTAVSALGEQLKQAELDLVPTKETEASTERAWREAVDRLEAARARADNAAAEAYKSAAELGQYGEYADNLHQYSLLVPGWGGRAGGQEAARDLLRAEQEERAANEAYRKASGVVSDLSGRRNTLKASFDSRSAALLDLRTRNAAEVARVEAASDAYEQSLGGTSLPEAANIDGKAADPRALAARDFALRQLGKPYLWGAEGPDRFDCSGLMWAAYRSVGYTLPRVANTQYNGTRPIQPTRVTKGDLLLPGDLLFFATDPNDWRSIHHVGMYIGGGRMVQSPTTGSFVKISPVWWSRFFGATRVFGAVDAPTPPPTPPPTAAATTPPPAATTPPVTSAPPTTPPPATSSPPTTTPPPSTEPPATSTPPPTTPAPTTPSAPSSPAGPASSRPASGSPASSGSGGVSSPSAN